MWVGGVVGRFSFKVIRGFSHCNATHFKPLEIKVTQSFNGAFTHISFAILHSPHEIASSLLFPSWLPKKGKVDFVAGWVSQAAASEMGFSGQYVH